MCLLAAPADKLAKALLPIPPSHATPPHPRADIGSVHNNNNAPLRPALRLGQACSKPSLRRDTTTPRPPHMPHPIRWM
jgi:hypothetical protein